MWQWVAVMGCGMVLWPLLLILLRTRYARRVQQKHQVQGHYDWAIVFGAATINGQPTDALRDRLDVGIALYEQGIVRCLLLSGGGQSPSPNETDVMQQYVMQRGIPPVNILVDPCGLRTFATCYRARHVYGLSHAVLVTQTFHLPRALFIAEQTGLTAFGVSADRRTYRDARWYAAREIMALAKAIFDVIAFKLGRHGKQALAGEQESACYNGAANREGDDEIAS